MDPSPASFGRVGLLRPWAAWDDGAKPSGQDVGLPRRIIKRRTVLYTIRGNVIFVIDSKNGAHVLRRTEPPGHDAEPDARKFQFHTSPGGGISGIAPTPLLRQWERDRP
jgi:hypothetical protein